VFLALRTGGSELGDRVTHGVSLSEDKRTVTLLIARNDEALSVDLGFADVDLLIDALTEMREHILRETSAPSALRPFFFFRTSTLA
jgi:hypothetical protein